MESDKENDGFLDEMFTEEDQVAPEATQTEPETTEQAQERTKPEPDQEPKQDQLRNQKKPDPENDLNTYEIEAKEKDKILDLESKVHDQHMRLRESQSVIHKSKRVFQAASRNVQSLLESGALTEEEADALLDTMNVEAWPETELAASPINSDASLLDRYTETWTKHLPVLDDLIGVNPKHIDAFEHYVKSATPSELEMIADELASLEDKPIKLTQKMLAIGGEYYEEVYMHLSQKGGYKGMALSHKKEVAGYQKEIDKLTQKMLQLEQDSEYLSNSKGTYNIRSSSPNAEKRKATATSDIMDSMFG